MRRLVDAKHQSDARDHLRAGIRAFSEMVAANRDIYRALHSMAQLDEGAVGGSRSRIEEERAGGMRRLAGRLAEQGVLREGLSAEEAENVLWLLTGFEGFDALLHRPRALGRADDRGTHRHRRAGAVREALRRLNALCYHRGVRTGRYSFSYVTYDPPSDVLYARVNQARDASRERTEDGDLWTFDADGRATGVIIMEPRERIARDGAVYVTLPTGERERLQGVEAAMRAA